MLHCPYHFAAAHVDASPLTTYGPRHLGKNRKTIPDGLERYNHLLSAGIQRWLPRTLAFCKNTVRLVVICCDNAEVEQKIRDTLGAKWDGEIMVKLENEVPRWAWENRERLIRLLDLEHVFA